MIFHTLFTAILLLLPCSMASRSPSRITRPSKHKLNKRLLPVLECDPRVKIPSRYPNPNLLPIADNSPAGTFLAEVKTFKTLTALCGGYPSGMGYYCPPGGGPLAIQLPNSQLYRFPGPPSSSQYLKDACLSNCYCTTIAPDDPDPSSSIPAAAQCLAAVGESDADEEPVSHGSHNELDAGGCLETFNDPEADPGVFCDATGYLFGHPANADCQTAQEGIGAGIDDDHQEETREFLGVGVPSRYNGGFPTEQTPFNWTSGTCYIQISLMEGRQFELENWDYLWGRANKIREQCVQGLGVGGSANSGDLRVYVQGPKSLNAELLEMKFGCVADADGNYSCEDDSEQPPAKKQKTSGASTDVGPPAAAGGAAGSSGGNRLSSGAQSGSCTNYHECDYRNGYTCAATKTAVDDFPVDASWGTFTCKLASTAASGAFHAAAAYVALGTTCRNRCLLDSNGTFNILANTTTTAAAATGPQPDALMKAPMLVAPCNCTYVSAACALSESGIVYEDPGSKINTVVGAPNGTVCCDGGTGQWKLAPVQTDDPPKNPLCPPPTSGTGGGTVQFG